MCIISELNSICFGMLSSKTISPGINAYEFVATAVRSIIEKKIATLGISKFSFVALL